MPDVVVKFGGLLDVLPKAIIVAAFPTRSGNSLGIDGVRAQWITRIVGRQEHFTPINKVNPPALQVAGGEYLRAVRLRQMGARGLIG